MSAQKIKNRSDPRYIKNENLLRYVIYRFFFCKKYVFALKIQMLCKETNLSRSTIKNHCDKLEDILERYDHEMWTDFLKIRFDELTPAEGWQRVMVFIQRYKVAFRAKFKQTDDRLVREMVKRATEKNGASWMRFDKKLAGRLFEMFYGEALGVLTIWVKEGMKTKKIDHWAEVLAESMKTAEKRWIKMVQQ